MGAVLHLSQGSEADEDWKILILDTSDQVWAQLGAQTRSCNLDTGTAVDAMQQFLTNFEDAIENTVDLPAAVKRYQDVLKYAVSRVDFVFGIGPYMAPSTMLFR